MTHTQRIREWFWTQLSYVVFQVGYHGAEMRKRLTGNVQFFRFMDLLEQRVELLRLRAAFPGIGFGVADDGGLCFLTEEDHERFVRVTETISVP